MPARSPDEGGTELTFTFTTTNFKDNFVNGWRIHVRPGVGFPSQPPAPDYYWDPRKGNWYRYTLDLNNVEDRGWAQVDISSPFVNPAAIYDQITAQYRLISEPDQRKACWDPRIGKWMSVVRKDGDLSGKVAALTELLRKVAEVHNRGYLSTHATDEIQTMIQREM